MDHGHGTSTPHDWHATDAAPGGGSGANRELSEPERDALKWLGLAVAGDDLSLRLKAIRDYYVWAVGSGYLAGTTVCEMCGYPPSADACVAAAHGGHLETIARLRSLDPPCPWDARAPAAAAGNYHLRVIRWMRDQEPPCPWDARTTASAARVGDAGALRWLLDHGCPVDLEECRKVANGPYVRELLDDYESAPEMKEPGAE